MPIIHEAEGKYNLLRLYLPLDKNSMAIEPMTCGSNTFKNKTGLLFLEPGAQYSGNYGIELQ